MLSSRSIAVLCCAAIVHCAWNQQEPSQNGKTLEASFENTSSLIEAETETETNVTGFASTLQGKDHGHSPHGHSPHRHNPHSHTPHTHTPHTHTPYPTPQPTRYPTPFPTPEPTGFPTPEPTGFPTPEPTGFPTPEPTGFPTPEPTTGSPTYVDYVRVGDVCVTSTSASDTKEHVSQASSKNYIIEGCITKCAHEPSCTGFDVGYSVNTPMCLVFTSKITGSVKYAEASSSLQAEPEGTVASGSGGGGSGSGGTPPPEREFGCYEKMYLA